MTSYLSSLSGQVANLKRLIPTSLSPESDLSVNDPEDSHVSRVLRAYYTEKGRPFPPWLGPDPRTPQQAAPVFANAIPQPSQGQSSGGVSGRSGRGLGDLFGDSSKVDSPQQESMSLRQPRRAVGPRAPPSNYAQSYQEPTPAARPLPSQRAGSYQNRSGGGPASKPSLAPETDLRRAPSAQDRLKARFGGSSSRAASSGSNNSNISTMSANVPWQGGDGGHDGYPDGRSPRRW